MENKYCLVTTANGSAGEVELLARTLVERKLTACMQVLPITSIYYWKEKLEHAPETLLLIQTQTRLYPQMKQALRELHPYNLPEILQLPIQTGLPAYLEWMDAACEGEENGNT